jgi:hypothetical protein
MNFGTDRRLAPKSTSPQTRPFASLSFCYYDSNCPAQLTSNTDNKVHKLVTVFAKLSCLRDSLLPGDITRTLRSAQGRLAQLLSTK